MKTEIITCGTANAYLIRGEDRSILFDTGTRKYRDKVLAHCKDAKVNLIVLSHGHFDHCHNASYIARELGCSIGITKEDAELLENGRRRKVYGKGIWGKFYAWASNQNIGRNEIEQTKVDVLIENGMSLSQYGINGKVIALPGHTRGSVGIFLSSGEMFVGDAMQNIISPSETWCFENAEQARETVARIQSLNPKVIYYGHGKPTFFREGLLKNN
ncbi:MBL fold metallo-hydrolase [Anaerosporobacter faecicola]|uniref:MBL fold metallo-hydrolase n=1 Tax=Anaerosporobacter faecicola TaxID=2718714 RepID=UPI00143C7973|nr:MBL fold metallo-hydrolase [Anaerosporobacter faecicola]